MWTDIFIAFLAVVLVGVVFTVTLWRFKDWADRSHVAQVVQAFAVVLTLALAWVQYLQYYEGDKARKRQAVIDIMRSTMGSQIFTPAFSQLYDQTKDDVLAMPPEAFKEVSSLADIFWTVGACVAADQCEADLVQRMFCYDFKTYEFAYHHVHQTPENRNQDFTDERLDVFCACPPAHRFSTHKPKQPAPRWAACPRTKNRP